MKQSQTKKVYIYPIKDTDGTPLDLINVLTHVSSAGVSNASGELNSSSRRAKTERLDRVDTFIGRNDRGEYVKVGSTEGLAKPGVIFRYASYVREQEALLGYYLDCYHENLHGLAHRWLCGSYCADNVFIIEDVKMSEIQADRLRRAAAIPLYLTGVDSSPVTMWVEEE